MLADTDGNGNSDIIVTAAADIDSASPIAPADPLLYYSFDDSSNIGQDSSGNGNNAGILNSVSSASDGVSGRAAAFGNSAADIQIASEINAGSEWTAAAWFKDIIDTSTWNTLFRGQAAHHQVIINNNGSNLGVWSDNGFVDSGYDVDLTGTANEWHHVTAVGTGTETRFYIDGEFVGASPEQLPGAFYAIGNRHDHSQQFAEQIDEVYIYDRVLSPAEISNLYRSVGTSTESVIAGMHNVGYIFAGETIASTSGSEEVSVGEHTGRIRSDDDRSWLSAIIAGDVLGDGSDDILFGDSSLSVTVEQVTPAVVSGAAASSLFPGFVSDLEITVGRLTDTITVLHQDGTDAGSTFTHDDLIETINTQIAAGPLAGEVTASLSGNNIQFTTNEGGSDVDIQVTSIVDATPLGYELGQDAVVPTNFQVIPNSTISAGGSNVPISGSVALLDVPPATVTGINVAEIYPGLSTTLSLDYSESQGSGDITFNDIDGNSVLVVRDAARNNQTESATLSFAHGSDLNSTVENINNQLALPSNFKKAKFASTKQPRSVDDNLFFFGFDSEIDVNGITSTGRGSTSVNARATFHGIFEQGDETDSYFLGICTFCIDYDITFHIASPSGVVKTVTYNPPDVENGDPDAIDGNDITIITTPTLNFSVTDDELNGTWTVYAEMDSSTLVGRSNDSVLNYWTLEFDVPFAEARATEGLIEIDAANVPRYHDGVTLSASAETVTTRPLGYTNNESSSGTSTPLNANSGSAPLLSGIASSGQTRVTIDTGTPGSETPFALGDLNHDGYDDIGFGTATGLDIHLGDSTLNSIMGSPHLTFAGTDVNVTAGDYDGNGRTDLTVLSGGASSQIAVINNISEFASGTALTISDANAILSGGDIDASTTTLGTVDLNDDRLDDLVIGASASQPNSVDRSYTVYGSRGAGSLPASFDVLENFNVTGSGSFIVDRGDGEIVFDDGGEPFAFGESGERWFRFTTLGDGRPGDVIRLDGEVIADLVDEAGRVLVSGQSVIDLRSAVAGTYLLRVQNASEVLSSDLASAVSYDAENGDWTGGPLDAVVGSGAVLQNVTSNVPGIDSAYVFDGTNGIDVDSLRSLSPDPTESSAAWEIWFRPSDLTGNEILFESGGVSGMAIVTEQVAGGIQVVLGIQKSGNAVDAYRVASPVISDISEFIQVFAVFDRTAATIQLYVNGKAAGAPVSAPNLMTGNWSGGAQGGIGRRNGDIGGYRVVGGSSFIGEIASFRFYRSASVVPSDASFVVSIDAPNRGQQQIIETDASPDRDIIRGGDGDDIIVGNQGLDRIFGGSGADTVTSEAIEIRDSDAADGELGLVPVTEQIAGNALPRLDENVTNLSDPHLLAAIAEASGSPVTNASGTPVVAGELRASDLTQLVSLQSNSASSLSGLHQATNLQDLDLQNAAGIGDSDLAIIASLSRLRSLDLRGTSVDPNSTANHMLLAGLTQLETLYLPLAGGIDAINLIVDEGQAVTINGAVFNATDDGYQLFNASGTDVPLFVRNVDPTLVVPTITGALEGQSIELGPNVGTTDHTRQILVDGASEGSLIVTDPASADVPDLVVAASITDPSGQTSSLLHNALEFDDEVLFLSNETLDGVSSLSTTFWLKSTGTGFQTVLSGANAFQDNEFFVTLPTTSSIRIGAKGSAPTAWAGLGNLVDGQYRHFAIVRDAETQQVELFIDGESKGTKALTITDPLDISPGGLLVGQEQDSLGGGFDSDQSLVGSLDELTIWDRALTAAEIADVMTGDFQNSDSNLRLYLPFDEGAGTVVADRGP
ncbi:MAG: LamG-like jellyroll fold domain-containing protein, partial [Planctomycetota bacterium]